MPSLHQRAHIVGFGGLRVPDEDVARHRTELHAHQYRRSAVSAPSVLRLTRRQQPLPEDARGLLELGAPH
ncbi:MAG: hypothetical protein M3Q39_13760, partial [Actinomycetota bacterium]|nr:hypothetical protein [Actinomycetota bacterium]